MLIQPTERAEHDRRVNNMSIRKVVAGLLIAAGIAIMAVPFFWRTTGEKQTACVVKELEGRNGQKHNAIREQFK